MYLFKGKYLLYALCTILAYSLLLCACGVKDKETLAVADEQDIEETIQMNELEKASLNIEEGNKTDDYIEAEIIKDNSYNIYNAVKFYDDYFYFSDADGIKRMSKDLLTKEKIAEGNVMFGNCDNDYIYYIRYPSDLVKAPGFFRMDLTRHFEEKLMDWTESMWSINSIYAHQNIIYFSEYDFCEAYEVIDANLEEIEEGDNIVYQILDNCGISHTDINNLLFGYVTMIFEYQKLLYFDEQKKEITVYDTKSGKKIDTLDQCRSDVLISDRGIIYKDLENDILLKKWDTEEPSILYDMSENDNRYINYGTFDEQYIFGFYVDGDDCTLVKIKWEGGSEIGRTFEDEKFCKDLRLSANNGVVSYMQDGYRVFEKK